MPLTDALRAELTQVIEKNDVVLFMKGTRQSPACGFSAQVVEILDELLPAYETVNVLASPEVRDGIKELSEWPTIPQLYVKGKFVGGCDIVRELHGTGELQKLLGVDAGAPAAPAIALSATALAAFRDAMGEAGDDVLRFAISPRFEYELYFGPKAPGDVVVDASGLVLHMDRGTARRADGARIDFVDAPEGGGFRIENPNEPPRVKTMTVRDLKRLLDAGEPVVLVDVRTDKERGIARIEGSQPLHAVDVEQLDKNARLVFQCHHGGRSQAAAEHFVQQGFRNVFNLRGGIDAWSQEIDASVPRY